MFAHFKDLEGTQRAREEEEVKYFNIKLEQELALKGEDRTAVTWHDIHRYGCLVKTRDA